MNRGRRVARVVVLALATGAASGLLGTGTAAAAPRPPVANAAFTRAGTPVYETDDVGVGCRTLGFCDGAARALATSATPRYLSTRAGEAVLVTCRSGGLAGVVGFFAGGDDVVRGWVDGNGVALRGDDPVPTCGALT
jgi:hypothetical protein